MPLTCEYLRFYRFFCVDLPTFSVTSKKFLTRLIERRFRARYSLASRALSNASGFCSTNPTHRFDEFFTLCSQFSTILRPRIYCALRFCCGTGLLFVGASAEKCAKNRYFTQIRPRRKKHGTMLDGGGIVQGFSFAIQEIYYIPKQIGLPTGVNSTLEESLLEKHEVCSSNLPL